MKGESGRAGSSSAGSIEADPEGEAAASVGLEALCAATRRTLDAVRRTRAPEDVLLQATRAMDALEALLAPHRHEGWLGQATLDGGVGLIGRSDDPMSIFPYSPWIGARNPIAPPMHLWSETDQRGELRVHGRVRFGATHCGPPNHVHGGVVSGIFDELLGVVNVINGVGAMTGTLTVRYRRPTPLHEELRVEGWNDRVDGRKVYTEGLLFHGDVLLAEAEGVFILVGQEARDILWRDEGGE